MSLLDSLRRPEHTGENRCLPCTAVNSTLVLAAAGIVGRRWRPAGAAVLAVGAAAIALRGYVVPYTPQFAPRLVDRLPVDFKGGTGPSSDSFATVEIEDEADAADGVTDAAESEASTADPSSDESDGLPDSDSLTALDADGQEVMVTLLDAGVIVDDGETVHPAGEFLDAWETAMADLRALDDGSLAATVADTAPFDGSGSTDGDWVVVEGDEQAIHLTRPVAIAETAAVQVMADYDVPAELRVEAAQPLRMFLETCPECGGLVEETNTDVCCGGSAGAYGGVTYEVLVCTDCEALVYEFDETVEA
jgi:hypothetical protein